MTKFIVVLATFGTLFGIAAIVLWSQYASSGARWFHDPFLEFSTLLTTVLCFILWGIAAWEINEESKWNKIFKYYNNIAFDCREVSDVITHKTRPIAVCAGCNCSYNYWNEAKECFMSHGNKEAQRCLE